MDSRATSDMERWQALLADKVKPGASDSMATLAARLVRGELLIRDEPGHPRTDERIKRWLSLLEQYECRAVCGEDEELK